MNQVPHKSIIAMSDHLRAAVAELIKLSDSLLPGSTKVASTVKPRRTKRPAKASTNRIAHLMPAAKGTNRLPAHLAKRVKALAKPAESRHLTKDEENDIVILLTKTDLPVSAIAKLFDITRAAVYGVRDRRGLKVHLGSPELMAGVRRLHNLRRVDRTRRHATQPALIATPVESAPASAPVSTPVEMAAATS